MDEYQSLIGIVSLTMGNEIEHRLIPDTVPIDPPYPDSGIVVQLEKLKALLDTGAISTSEYEKLKTKLLKD